MIAAALAASCELTIVIVDDAKPDASSEGTSRNESRNAMFELPKGRIATVEYVSPPDLETRLKEIGPDVLIANETALAPVAIATGVSTIVSLQNVESALWREVANTASGSQREEALQRSKRNLLIERRVLPRASQIWVVGDNDATAISEIVGGGDFARKISIVPNVVLDPDPEPTAKRPAIAGRGVFFGSLWWSPNEQAVVELVALSDRIARRGIDHRFSIAGQGAPESLRAIVDEARAVELAGFVPDLAAFVETAACAVLPVVSGGGSMVKLLDAMRLGVPVLTTPQGARGIAGLEAGVHLVVYPLGREFDDACIAMLTDPESFAEMGRRARSFVGTHFSLSALDTIVGRLIRQ